MRQIRMRHHTRQNILFDTNNYVFGRVVGHKTIKNEIHNFIFNSSVIIYKLKNYNVFNIVIRQIKNVMDFLKKKY